MSMIKSSDPDFRVCQIDFDTLLDLQERASERGWGTRWSSSDALREQVKAGSVILMTMMRQTRGADESAVRCLVLFAAAAGAKVGAGVATLDVDPEVCASLPRVDHDPATRPVFARVFALATGGIEMVSKS